MAKNGIWPPINLWNWFIGNYNFTSTGKEVEVVATACPACDPELESSKLSSLAYAALSCSALDSLILKVGMGSRACSKNSRILGVIIVSSGMLWRLIQAEN